MSKNSCKISTNYFITLQRVLFLCWFSTDVIITQSHITITDKELIILTFFSNQKLWNYLDFALFPLVLPQKYSTDHLWNCSDENVVHLTSSIQKNKILFHMKDKSTHNIFSDLCSQFFLVFSIQCFTYGNWKRKLSSKPRALKWIV